MVQNLASTNSAVSSRLSAMLTHFGIFKVFGATIFESRRLPE